MPRTMGFLTQAVLPGALLALVVLPHVAHATLGEPESTVAAEAQHLRVSVKSTERVNYRLHEMQLPSGTRLREFADAGGTVFAVAWTGPAKPDLRQALGKYFDTYIAAAASRQSHRAPLLIQAAGFTMEAGGHMRSFTGRAYLPASVPAGTALEDIR